MFKYLNPINWFKRKPAAFSPTTVLRAKVGYVTADDMATFISQTYHSAEGQPNDDLTRSILTAHIVNQFLGWRCKVVCDERNNPPHIRDSNKLGLTVHYVRFNHCYTWDSDQYNHTPDRSLMIGRSIAIQSDMRRPKADRYEHSEIDANGVTTVYEGGTSSKPVEQDVLRFRTGDGKIHTMYASPEAKARVQQRAAEERRRREEDAERVRRDSEDRWRRDEDERRNASMLAAAMAPTAFSPATTHSPAPTYEASCLPPPSYESPSPSPSYDSGSCSSGDY